MTACLVHIGCMTGPLITTFRPPKWMWHSVQQYFTFNDGSVYILTDRENIPYLPKHDRVIPVALEDHYSNKIGRFHAVYPHGVRDFWTVCATRFIYLENFMRKNDLQDVCHFDNDVLVYFNVAERCETLRRLYPGIGMTPESPRKSPAGFIYINNYKALESMTDFFIKHLGRHGERVLGSMYEYGVVNEMLLIVDFKKNYPELIADLPIVPHGEHSSGVDEFGAIFDPLTWGEVVDGTRQGKLAGHHSPDAYIVEWLKRNPSLVIWKTENGLRCPYLNCEGELTKINNLHMHSKNLVTFMSRQR